MELVSTSHGTFRTRFLEPLIRHANALSGKRDLYTTREVRRIMRCVFATVNLPTRLAGCQLFRYQRDKSTLFAGTIVDWLVIAPVPSATCQLFARLRYQVNPY